MTKMEVCVVGKLIRPPMLKWDTTRLRALASLDSYYLPCREKQYVIQIHVGFHAGTQIEVHSYVKWDGDL